MISNGQIENIAASVVREFLSRKGFKSTLQAMDSELPRTEDSISNRAQLAKELRIEKILKKNKESSKPLRSMIEVIVKFLVEKAAASSSKEFDGIPEQRSLTDVTTRAEKKSSRPSSARRKESSEHKRRTEDPAPARSSSDVHSSHEAPDFSGLPQQDISPVKLHREPTTVVTMKDKPNVMRLDPPDLTKDLQPTIGESPISDRNAASLSTSTNKERDQTTRNKRPGSASRSRGLAGPITSSLDGNDRKRGPKYSGSRSTTSLSSPNTSISLDAGRDSSSSLLNPSPVKKETSSSSRSMLKSFGFDLSPENTSDNLTRDGVQTSELLNSAKEKTNDDFLPASHKEGRPSSRQRRSIAESDDVETSKHGSGRPSSRHGRHEEHKKSSSSSSGSQKKTKEVSKLGDLEMGDVDDLVDDLRDVQLGSYMPSGRKPIDSRPITLQLAMQLKTVLFGSATGCFNEEWRRQGFGFSEIADLPYGIVQHKGGPCGVLASLQACMLQRLLFAEGSSPTASTLKQIPSKKRTDSLVQAITDIVWRAGQKRNAVVALPTGRAHFTGGGVYKSDGLTETITLNLFKTRDETQEFVQANIRTFAEGRGCGCILLLYSTLFSRTIDMVIEDMDEPTNRIIGQHGYCTQEMVNLILTGKAVSNVFNDVVELGSGKEMTRLKGLSGRCDIGLLSLFEHYKSCQVGTYFKTPRHPIWVVCSESHFSVLFSLKKELMSDWRVERHFDLYYYDGLAKQQEEIRLSIDTTQSCPPTDNDDLIPPLELCIRTKWPDAVVNWNGTEPIL